MENHHLVFDLPISMSTWINMHPNSAVKNWGYQFSSHEYYYLVNGNSRIRFIGGTLVPYVWPYFGGISPYIGLKMPKT